MLNAFLFWLSRSLFSHNIAGPEKAERNIQPPSNIVPGPVFLGNEKVLELPQTWTITDVTKSSQAPIWIIYPGL